MFGILKNWITSIVVIVMFMALVDMILPSNSLKKYAKLVMGMIIIIIIITPIFNLFDRGNNIEAVINQYINKYDTINNIKDTNVKSNYNPEIIKTFKDNLKSKIEKSIYDDCNKKYVVTVINVVENQNAANFLDIAFLELKTVDNKNEIKAVSKITLKEKINSEDYFWDKEVVNVLKNKFNIKSTAIKFVK